MRRKDEITWRDLTMQAKQISLSIYLQKRIEEVLHKYKRLLASYQCKYSLRLGSLGLGASGSTIT